MHEKQLWLYTVTAYQLSYQENTRSDVWCFDKWRKACYAKHELDLAKHKRYSIPIGPNEVMRYDVTYFFRLFVWPNIISDGLTNELSKRIKKQLRWHGGSSFTTCAEGPVCCSGQLQTKDINYNSCTWSYLPVYLARKGKCVFFLFSTFIYNAGGYTMVIFTESVY